MAEDTGFDPSLKKKKKKTKKIVDLDASEEPVETAKSEETSLNEITNKENETVLPVQESQEKEDVALDDMNFDDFSSMKKKKKKKKKKGFEDGQENVEVAAKEATENNDENGVKEDQIDDDEMNLSLPMKKKKKKRPNENEIKPDEGEKEGSQPNYADREYTYEELLTRVFDTMKAKNPDVVAGEKRKFIMRPPQVFKIGTKKTSFANFGDICKILHRQPKHLLAYLLAELGTSGSIDSNNQLIIKGRFQQKQIENVLRRYIKEYVTCHTCRSPETILQKETRLFFLQCETCGSRCSVASIKSGFQALTGRRAALKSKQQ